MSIKILKEYLHLCNLFNIEPTIRGINRFKTNFSIIAELSKEELQSVIFDVITLL